MAMLAVKAGDKVKLYQFISSLRGLCPLERCVTNSKLYSSDTQWSQHKLQQLILQKNLNGYMSFRKVFFRCGTANASS